jgi:hypothetical protein
MELARVCAVRAERSAHQSIRDHCAVANLQGSSMTVVTVVLVRDRKTGEIDPSAPALIYAEDGRCIEARRLKPQEIDLLAGDYCAQMRAQVTTDGMQLTGRWAH